MLLTACREASRWREPLQVSVNLSPLNLAQTSLVRSVDVVSVHSPLYDDTRAMFEMMDGASTYLYASDYPHQDFDTPASIWDVPQFTEDEKRAIDKFCALLEKHGLGPVYPPKFVK